MHGLIFQIQRFSVYDGPGIRTAVFMKGCPLRCRWCHNPEGQSATTELLYDSDKCTGCGQCIRSCPTKAHSWSSGEHLWTRNLCVGCGRCVTGCGSQALELSGRRMSAQEVIENVLRDRLFFGKSGGVTFSGGEPLAQPDFLLEMLRLAKSHQLHCCLETSGYGEPDLLSAAAELTDLFLFDIKLLDSPRHRQWTGVDNELILKNLRRLNDCGVRIVLRCPIIQGVNAEPAHYAALAALAAGLDRVEEVHIEPYHPLGLSKLRRLSRFEEYDNQDFFARSEALRIAALIERESRKRTVVSSDSVLTN